MLGKLLWAAGVELGSQMTTRQHLSLRYSVSWVAVLDMTDACSLMRALRALPRVSEPAYAAWHRVYG